VPPSSKKINSLYQATNRNKAADKNPILLFHANSPNLKKYIAAIGHRKKHKTLATIMGSTKKLVKE
jgi:hypothetical protein